MVRVRRERGEVIMSILRVALKGAKKTHIQQLANMNPAMLKRYFSPLVKAGLLEACEDPNGDVIYRTTDKGKSLLRMAEQFYGLLRESLDAH